MFFTKKVQFVCSLSLFIQQSAICSIFLMDKEDLKNPGLGTRNPIVSFPHKKLKTQKNFFQDESALKTENIDGDLPIHVAAAAANVNALRLSHWKMSVRSSCHLKLSVRSSCHLKFSVPLELVILE